MPARSLCARLCPAGIRAAVFVDVGAVVCCTASVCKSPAPDKESTFLYQSVGEEGSAEPLFTSYVEREKIRIGLCNVDSEVRRGRTAASMP